MCKKAKKILKKAQEFSLGKHVVERLAEATDSPGLQAVLNPTVYAVSGKEKFEKKAKAEAQQKAERAEAYQKQQEAEARAKEADAVNAELLVQRRKRKQQSLLATAGGGGGLGSGGSVLTSYGKNKLGA